MSDAKLPRGPITAEQLARLKEQMLAEDPEYRARVEAADAERRKRAEALREAERPIVDDINATGLSVSSVWDLVNTSTPYSEALPVLLAHFERGGYPDRVMESLGRALAVKPSVAWWDRLKARYLGARSAGEEDGAAVALAACATRSQFEDLVAFLGIEERGDSRIYFLRPIKRLGGEEGRQLLASLREDPTFAREARALLGKTR